MASSLSSHHHHTQDTQHSVEFLWTSDKSDAKTLTWQHDIHRRKTAMPPVGFEPTIPASEWPQTHTLFRADTGIGFIVEQFSNFSPETRGTGVCLRCFFESRFRRHLSWQWFCGFPQSLQANIWILRRPVGAVATKPFPVHHSWIMPNLNAVKSELMTMMSSNPTKNYFVLALYFSRMQEYLTRCT